MMLTKVKPLFKWYDMWIGLFWDNDRKWLYIFPLPMIGVVIQLIPKEYKIEKVKSSWKGLERIVYIVWHVYNNEKSQVTTTIEFSEARKAIKEHLQRRKMIRKIITNLPAYKNVQNDEKFTS